MNIEKYKETISKMDKETLKRELNSLKNIGEDDEIKYKISLVLAHVK